MTIGNYMHVCYENKSKFVILKLIVVSSESGFICLEVKYRSENVISAKIGRLSRDREEACNLFFDSSVQSTTLISKFFTLQKLYLNIPR